MRGGQQRQCLWSDRRAKPRTCETNCESTSSRTHQQEMQRAIRRSQRCEGPLRGRNVGFTLTCAWVHAAIVHTAMATHPHRHSAILLLLPLCSRGDR